MGSERRGRAVHGRFGVNGSGEEPTDGPKQKKLKSFEIRKRLVFEAWEKVRANSAAPGVDAVSIDDFAADEVDNLYKLWNRMSSGSYFPGPVRTVEIPKDHGAGVRVLGVANVADRVAQTAAAMLLEEKLEPILCPDSYGYRPGRSAHDALAVARKRCWNKDWVLDLDVGAFFDSVGHDLLMRAVAHHTDERWVLLYIEGWLKAPMTMRDGTHAPREIRTPQGSPISPLLANLFMHYGFDKWMDREHSRCPFERYADDVVIHCDTEQQAQQLWAGLVERLGSLGLELHRDKTKIVYCKDTKRRDEAGHTSFDFLGYTFRGRLARGRRGLFRELLTSGEPQREAGDRQTDQGLAPQPSQCNGPRRTRPGHQRPDPRLVQLLRGLLPLRVVCHRSAHRRTPRPMGDAEVQTIARPTHQSKEMARRCPSARATTLRPLAPPRFNPTPNCGSRMTGDRHVRF